MVSGADHVLSPSDVHVRPVQRGEERTRPVPVGTMAIGKAGAINAALLATAILGNKHPQFRGAYERFRADQTQAVLQNRIPGNAAAH